MDGLPLQGERPDVAVLGPYRLVERLGTGGMGVVYRAVHEKLGRTVAIKMLHRGLVADKTTIARFFQEARTVNTIRHPNVVEVYDFVSAGADIYMVMEFLVGRDLHAAIEDQGGRPLSPQRTVHILEQVCGALAAAHAQNIIHRDLKPANIFLCDRREADDFVKLLDFGLAKRERGEGKMTRDGVVLGTVEYMAPEQARGEKLDGRTDLYAVGCIAFEMLTGRRLFGGGNFADVMARHVGEAPPSLRELNPEVPAALDQTVLRCLSKSREERPRSAQDLAQELCGAVRMAFDATGLLLGQGPKLPPGATRVPSGGRPAITLSPVVRPIHFSQTVVVRRSGIGARVGAIAAAAGAIALLGLWAAAGTGEPRRRVAAQVPSAAPRVATPEPRPVAVRLDSTPAGAEIWEDGDKRIGVTPLDLLVTPGSSHLLRFVKPGYVPVEQTFRVNASTTIAVSLKAIPARPAPPPRPPRPQPKLAARSRAPEPAPRRREAPRAEAPAPEAPAKATRTGTLNPFTR